MKLDWQQKRIKLITPILIAAFLIPQITWGAPAFLENKYPRLANYFLKWNLTNDDAREVARWDLVVLVPQPELFNPEAIKIIRQTNPKIKLLAYISAAEIPSEAQSYPKENIWRQMFDLVDQNNWWLKDPAGNHLGFWPGNWLINVSDQTQPNSAGQRWSEVLPELINQTLLSKNQWDGIFFDNTWDEITWINQGKIDISNNGQFKNNDAINNSWRQGMNKLFVQARNLFGPDKIIVANGSDFYNQYLNGRMYENFPDVSGNWPGVINLYTNQNNGYSPFASIINANTANSDDRNNYQKFRYGLASALLGNGFYSFDRGDQTHRELWWYDEYNAFLGKPVSRVKNLINQSDQIKTGVWQREFQNGLALVNSTNQTQTINLGAEFEKIRGTEDPATNDGGIVTNISLAPTDGLILLRPIENIIGQTFTNASFIRIFDPNGQAIRNGFFAYNSAFRGSTNIITKDLKNDGNLETVVAEKDRVEVYNSDNKLITQFFPYGKNFNGGINLAIGDLNNDGQQEIVTGPIRGGSQIRIFSSSGRLLNPGFFAFNKKLTGGVSVAIGDVLGNGQNQIVAGAGLGDQPQIKIFNQRGQLVSRAFLAFEKNFRGGISVAVGNTIGGGTDQIIVGKGIGGEPWVKIFTAQGKLINHAFLAFDRSNKSGVKVIAYDIDGAGRAKILAASNNVFTAALINH